MTHTPAPHLNWQTGAPAVTCLVPRTNLRLDYEALARLHIALGPRLAGATLARAHAELEHQVQAVAIAQADCDLDGMIGAIRRLRRLSLDIGLPELRRAADHVLDCLSHPDGSAAGANALAATISRLVRVGVAALSQVGALRLPGN